jgi:plastocyanin
VGETLVWTNVDGVPHTVTSGSRGQAEPGFDSGFIGPGQSFVLKFNEPGEYSYTCTLHPFMNAKVVVTP